MRIAAIKSEYHGLIPSRDMNVIFKLIPSKTAVSKKLSYCEQEKDVYSSDPK